MKSLAVMAKMAFKDISRPLILLAFLALVQPAVADEQDGVFGLGGSLSNAYLPGNPSKSAIAMTVIDRRMIEASGAQNLGDILRIVPGLVTGSRFGHSLSFGSHGNADEYMRRTNVIIDGRSLFTPVVGGLISFNMPVTLEDIERIEVYRGPAGSEFGSNAMINTVKIYTASAMEKQGSKLKFVKGENHQQDGYVQSGFEVGNAFFTTSYSSTENVGLRNRDDDTKRHQVFLRGDYQLDERNEFTVTTGASRQDIDVWITSNPDSNNHDADDESAFINMTWVHALEEGSVVSNFAHTYLNRESYYLTAPVNPVVGRLFYDTGYSYHSTTADSKLTRYFGDAIEMSLGGKFSHDEVNSDSLFQKDAYSLNSSAVYGKFAWELIDGTTFHVGSMYEQADVISDNAHSYNAAIVQELTKNHMIRVGYNKGTRLPWIYEQHGARKFYLHDNGNVPYYDVYNVGDLEPEEVVQHDISWLYNNHDAKLSTEVRVYQDQYKSLIANQFAPNPGINSSLGNQVNSFQSFDSPSTVKGVEISANWQPSADFLLVASTSFMDIDAHLEEGTYTGNVGEAGPSNTFSLLAEYKFLEHWKTGGMFSRVSGYNWSNGWYIESQEALDLYVQRCFADYGAKGFCTKLGGKDLFGGKADFRPEAYWERAYRLEASLEF